GEGTVRSERKRTTQQNFEGIVGTSAALRAVLEQVEVVAPTESTVLIVGETGTGKELIARAIHTIGSRCSRPFVKLNCAAIPSGLLESELFGDAKGAFTGAMAERIGRFELAHGGTLFLDEVGDISVGATAQAAARAAGPRVRAPGKHPNHSGGCAAGRGNQPGPGADGGRETISRGSLFSARRFPNSDSTAAGAGG